MFCHFHRLYFILRELQSGEENKGLRETNGK